MNKFFLSFAMALVTAGAAYSASIWNGTADVSWYDGGAAQSYNITTPEQLAGLAELVNGGTADFNGKSITLGTDIFLNDTTGWGAGNWKNKTGLNNWVPIGTETNAFKGEFNGIAGRKNRKIFGLYCEREGSYVGLFGNATSKIQNIDLLVGYVSSTKRYIGSVAGYAKVIENTHSTLQVLGQGISFGWIGGLAGVADTIRKSSVEIDSIVYDYVNNRGSSIGGIAGEAKAVFGSSFKAKKLITFSSTGGIAGRATTIVDCHVEVDSIVGASVSGGLVGNGLAGCTIKKSSAKGLVKGMLVGGTLNQGNIGGLVGGYSACSIDSSYHEGDVVGGDSKVGGLASVASTISYSYHKGNVYGRNYVGGLAGTADSISYSYHKDGDVTGTGDYVGGLVGQGKVIVKSYAYGNIVHDNDYYSYTGGLAGEATSIDSSYHSGGSVSGGTYVGGLAGKVSSTIKNSYAENDVTGTGKSIGGLVGRGKDIVKSYASGKVTGTDSCGGLAGVATSIDSSYHTGGSVSGGTYVGGLAGKVSSIKNSYAENDVTGTGKHIGGLVGWGNTILKSRAEGQVEGASDYVGGLAGSIVYSIDSSTYYTDGSVKGFAYVGGLSGYAYESITNSHSTAAKVEGHNYVGGLVGYTNYPVKKSFFDGDSVKGIFQVGGLIGRGAVVDSCRTNVNVLGDDNVGGLVGSGYGDITYSTAEGNVNGDVENSSAGNDNLGGLVGYQYSGSIHHSAAHVNVYGTTKLGGLVGRFDGTEITQSYANGNVTGSYYGDPADEVGNYYIGGLVGYASGSIDETYVSGIVKGIENDPFYTGCIVGYVNGSLSITNSYYDKTKCGLGVDGGEGTASVAGVPDKTTVEMKTKSTYADWNFEDVWDIVENSYPYLRVEDAFDEIWSSSSSAVIASSASESDKSSSSAATQNSSGANNSDKSSDSSTKPKSSNSEKTDHIVLMPLPGFSIQVVGRNLHISGAKTGALFALFDMQGKALAKGRVQSADFELLVANPGNYILRVENASRKIQIK